MAVRTDPRRGSFARKELLTVTVDARLMIGKLGNVGKRIALFANEFPIRGRKLVARFARQPMLLVAV